MKVSKCSIYSFGKIIDQTYEIEENGLVIISGKNESGKTHVRYFLTYMLVGLSKQEIQRFNHLHNHVFGGEITLIIDNEEYTLYRTDKTQHQLIIKNARGEDVTLEVSHKYLKQLDRTFFDRVFHFDVLTIQKEQRETPEQIGDLLLSLSMSGTDAIDRTEKKLKKELDHLFKKGGSKPVLNEQLEELESLEKKLIKLKKEEASYDSLENSIKAVTKEKRTREKEIKENKQQLRFYQTYLQLYHVIECYKIAEGYLNTHNEPFNHPDVYENDVTLLYEEKEQLRQKLSQQEERMRQVEEKRESVAGLIGDGTRFEYVLKVINQDMFWREKQRVLDETNKDIEDLSTQINKQTLRLGLSLTEEQMLMFELPEENVSALELLTEQQKKVTEHIMNEQAELNQLSREGDALAYERHQLNHDLLSDYQREDMLSDIERLRKHKEKRMESMRLLPFFGILTAVFLSLLVTLSNMNLFQPVIIYSLLGVYILSLFGLILLQRPKPHQVEGLVKHISKADEDMLKEYYDVLHRDETARVKREQLSARWSIYTNQSEKTERDISVLKEKEAAIKQEIGRFHDQYPFLKSILNTEHSTVLRQVYELQQVLKLRKKLGDKRSRLNEEISTYVTAVIKDLELTKGLSLVQVLKEVGDLYNQLSHQRQVYQDLQEELIEIEAHNRALESKLNPVVEKLEAIFQMCNVSDYHAFLESVEYTKAYNEKIKEYETSYQKMALYFSSKDMLSVLDNGLIDELSLKETIGSYNNELQLIEKTYEDCLKNLATLHAEKKQMETSTIYRDVAYQFNIKRELFNKKAREWLMYKTSYDQLLQTKIEFQTSLLPSILNKASEVFCFVTDGRYTAISFDSTTSELIVDYPSGSFKVAELSQGTLDQLVIAIRLGVATELSRTFQMPFIIDDSFVHFDDERKRRLFDYLKQQERQSFYFTTEPKERLKEYHVMTLEE